MTCPLRWPQVAGALREIGTQVPAQLVVVDRFGEKHHARRYAATRCQLVGGQPGQDGDADVGQFRVGHDGADNFEAIDAIHNDVREQDVGRTAGNLQQRLVAVFTKDELCRQIPAAELALVQLRESQLNNAIALYQALGGGWAAAQADPNFADAWNNLAQVQLELGQRPQAAKAIARAVALGGPREARYRDLQKKINEKGAKP